jgi:hypothetical protein
VDKGVHEERRLHLWLYLWMKLSLEFFWRVWCERPDEGLKIEVVWREVTEVVERTRRVWPLLPLLWFYVRSTMRG